VRSAEPRRPVQVRLPASLDDFLSQAAKDRRESKTDVVIEALNCLREKQIEALMEEGYQKLADAQRDVVEAGLAAAMPIIPE
jgi:hypothetical protein